jgi:hypothetical protein
MMAMTTNSSIKVNPRIRLSLEPVTGNATQTGSSDQLPNEDANPNRNPNERVEIMDA